MFTPKRLYVKDFMNHRESDVDFTLFNSCLVVGKNCQNDRESNGSGKSNLIDRAINYVLFNKYPTKKIERVVREGMEQCLVEFEFYIDQDIWKATRKRSNTSNKSEARLYRWIDSKWDSQDRKTSSQTEQALQELIKINYDAFKNSVMFEQGSFSELAAGTETQKRNILKEPLRLAIYSKLEKIAKKKYGVVEKEFEQTKTLISSLGNPATDIVVYTGQIEELENAIVQGNKDRKEIKSQIAAHREAVSDLEKMLGSDEVQITDRLVELDKKRRELVASKNYHVAQVQKSETDLAKSLEAKNNALKKITELKTELDKLEATKVRSEPEVNDLILAIESKESRGHKYIAGLEVRYEKYSKPLPSGSECDVCFNELTDEYREKISEDNRATAAKITKDLASARNKMTLIAGEKRKLYQELKDISRHQQQLTQIAQNINSKIEEVGRLDNVSETFKKLITEHQDAATLSKNTLVELEKKDQLLRDKAKALNVNEINNKIIELKNKIEEDEIKENKLIDDLSQNSSFKAVVEERKRTRETDQQQLEELTKQRTQLERKVRIHAWVVKAFSAGGIPTLIIHTILDDLQVEANKILQDLRPDLSLRFKVEKEDKDALDITYFIKGKEREYAQLSGGQKMYMAFALKLGLSQVIQKRLGVDIRFLALDEVDQPLDDAGQDAYVDIIRKYHDKYKICVVTHNNRLKDKFSHAIFVEDDGVNGSTAKVVTQW